MAGDDLLCLDVHAEELAHALRDIAVRGAMETIAAYMPLGVELVRHSVEIGIRRHGAVESIVKHRDLRCAGHEGIDSAETSQVAFVVYRSKVDEALNAFLHLGSDDATLLKEITSLHDAVSHGVDLVETLQTAVFRIYQQAEHKLHAFLVVRHVVHDLLL